MASPERIPSSKLWWRINDNDDTSRHNMGMEEKRRGDFTVKRDRGVFKFIIINSPLVAMFVDDDLSMLLTCLYPPWLVSVCLSIYLLYVIVLAWAMRSIVKG